MPKGGYRENAGRPKGRKNNATIAREKATQAVIEKITSGLTQEEIGQMGPVELMLYVMREMAKSGDLRTAVMVAKEVAPYTNAKRGIEGTDPHAMPADLLPDPDPEPDEPGPPGGAIA
jgi:hypothetical protein